MKLNVMAFAVPLFLFFMLLEYVISRRKNKSVHQFGESIANLNVGIAERVTDLLTTGAFYFVFSWVYENFAFFHIQPSILTWVLLFLFTDLVWYWYHRFGHEVNIFWGVHVVHHQSEDFNYTVSGRITVLQAVARGIFWSILPLIGFPPSMIAVLLLIHGAYPFFTHTQMIGKLGWLEYLFVTPSHHRVHHSSNPEYLDKNYGDVLIIWDKLFGTFVEEKDAPVYGLTSPLKSHSFLWQHFHFLLEMAVAFKRAKGLKKKFRVLFGKPDDIDPRIRPYLERKLLSKATPPVDPAHLTFMIRLQTVMTLVLLFFTVLLSHYLSTFQLYIAAFFLLISVVNSGAMLEQRRWVFYLDFIRLSLLGLFIYSFYPFPQVSASILTFLFTLTLFYKTLRQRYYTYLYPCA